MRVYDMQLRLLATLAMTLVPALTTVANVQMPSVFGSGMVLQQGLPIRVWGWADAGEQVSVTLGDTTVSATADVRHQWRAELPARVARFPHTPLQMIVKGTNTLTFDNVLIGEVWLCSGQSNMLFRLNGVRNALEEIAAAEHPQIRLLQVQKSMAYEPQQEVKGKWAVCSAANAGEFSAVAYYFGRQLQQDLKVPVGLIHASWGGTRIHSWTPSTALVKSHPHLIQQGNQWLASFPERVESSRKRIAEWEREAAAARAAGLPEPDRSKRPRRELKSDNKPHYPGVLYNAMIAPFAPLSIRGVTWYQGESNTAHPDVYESLLGTMIDAWRSAFQNPDLYFGVVQIANFKTIQTEADELSGWAEVRAAQARVAAGKHGVGLAVTVDIGEADNVHPLNKLDVGRRLATGALHHVYGRDDVTPSGPVMKSVTVRDGKMVLTFDYASGLSAKGEKLEGFIVAGADGKFEFAEAVIEGHSVVVSSAKVPQPAAVRYGWADNPRANLYNADGLPAVPFRTDATKPTSARPDADLPDEDDPQRPE